MLGSAKPVDRTATLEKDGRGMIAFTAPALGPMTLVIPAGLGKRALLLSQVSGPAGGPACQWTAI